MDILDAFNQLQGKVDNKRKIVNGMLAMHDEVFKIECYKLGVDWQEWIDEPVEYRDLILEEIEQCKKNNS